MIETTRFWEEWSPGLQRFFKFFGAIVIMLGLALIVAALRSPAPTITWQYLQEVETIDQVVRQFQIGPFSLQVLADNIVLFEKMAGNEFVFQMWPAFLFMAFVIMGFIILVTILSTVSRFWFFIGAGVLIFMLSGLQLELLNVLGMENQAAAIFLIVTIIGTGLLFQYYFQAATIVERLLVFTGVIIVSFSLLLFLAEVPNPVYLLAVGFVPSTVIASALLAIVTAHEIIATIVYLITRGLKGSNGFRHFILLSTIYLGNLVATYLNDQAYLSWDYSLNPILLLMFSAILAIWGIRRQQEQMDDFLLTGAAGPLGIIGLCIVAFSASAFFYTTGNDAAIETIRNMSLYAHIGFGVIFVLYIVSNFGALLKDNYPVIRVLYKPKSMPFFTFRLAGLIVMVGFILYNFWLRPIKDTRGARDVAMGDYYVMSDNIKMAEGYYRKSDFYAFHNHHANFVLANIEGVRRNSVKERQYYLNAAERRPTQQAYMNAIATLDQSAINLYAYLRNVRKDFPNSGAANNAMGLVYARFNQLDSAIYFFNLAKKDSKASATAEINLLATAIKQKLNLNADSIYQRLSGDELGPKSNVFALANSEGILLNHDIELEKDTALNLFSASLISNYLLNHIDSLDTTFITKAVKLAKRQSNNGYLETVQTSSAFAYYQSGQINRAFKLMQEATVYSQNQGAKNNTMALWALDQGAPGVALDYIQYALYQRQDGALLTKAIALAEAGNHGEAIILFDSLKRTDKDIGPLAEAMLRVLAVDKKLVGKLNDLEKYAYCRYRVGYQDSVEFEMVSSSITNPDWKARTILDRSKKLFDWDELNQAITVFNKLGGVSIIDKNLYSEIQHHEMRMAAANGSIDILKSKIKGGQRWSGLQTSEKLYYDALIALALNDSVKAKHNLKWLARQNSFFVDGVVLAAMYAKRNSNEMLEAYNILAEAVQNNPRSVRLLKAYIQEASNLGFDEYAANSLETLRQVLPEPLFKKFLNSIR